jgi:hypothetical protein
MVNALGSLDVDIILDEGPDTINAQQDVYETLSNVLPAIAPMLSPPMAQAAVKALIDNSSMPASAKKAIPRGAAEGGTNPAAAQPRD